MSTLLVPAVSSADEVDVFNIEVLASQRYDSNLFRLADGVLPFGTGRRSATTQSTGVGLKADKTYGLQRLSLDATVTHDHYSPYGNLDTTARNLRAAWAWAITPSVTGDLSIGQSVVPNNFSDTGVQTRANDRKTEDRRFDVDWRPGAAIHPRVSLLQNEDKSEQTTLVRQNSKTTSIESALVYEFRSNNLASLYFRRGRGNYVNQDADPVFQSDSQFDERETGLTGLWTSSGSSTFTGRLGYLTRRHRTFAARDFGGIVGSLSFIYSLTGKTQIQLSGTRVLSSTQTAISSYSDDQIYAITPIWFATGKITVRPTYAITRRTFKGSIVPVAQNLRQISHDATLQVDWAALRSFDVSLAAGKSNRVSNDPTYQFSDHFVSIFGTLRF